MKLNITLKDPKYCDGCPFLANFEYCAFYCKGLKMKHWRKKIVGGWTYRPKQCVEENGE